MIISRGLFSRHVVAASFQLHHGSTAITPLKLILLCGLYELQKILIFRTFSVSVGFAVAHGANFGFTSRTFSDIPLNLLRLYPFSAVWFGAVDTVRCCVLDIFLVPQFFGLVVEKLIDMLKRDVVFGTTLGRHVGRIGQREREYPFQAIVAPIMPARKLRSFPYWDVVGKASNTLDPIERSTN